MVVDRLRKHLARGLVTVVEHADAQRLGQADRLAGAGSVVAQQPVGVGEPGYRESVLRLRVVDAVAAGQVAPGGARDRRHRRARSRPAARRQHVSRPADQIERDDRPAAHRVDVGERVRSRDPTEVIRVVDDGREEVGGRDDRSAVQDTHDGRVIPAVESDEQVAAGRCRNQTSHKILQLARRDLAGASPTVGVLGQPEAGHRLGHPVTVVRGQLMMITPGPARRWAANRGRRPAK